MLAGRAGTVGSGVLTCSGLGLVLAPFGAHPKIRMMVIISAHPLPGVGDRKGLGVADSWLL